MQQKILQKYPCMFTGTKGSKVLFDLKPGVLYLLCFAEITSHITDDFFFFNQQGRTWSSREDGPPRFAREKGAEGRTLCVWAWFLSTAILGRSSSFALTEEKLFCIAFLCLKWNTLIPLLMLSAHGWSVLCMLLLARDRTRSGSKLIFLRN